MNHTVEFDISAVGCYFFFIHLFFLLSGHFFLKFSWLSWDTLTFTASVMMMLTVSMVTHTHTHTQSGNPWLSRHHITLNSPGIIHITSLLLSKEWVHMQWSEEAHNHLVDAVSELQWPTRVPGSVLLRVWSMLTTHAWMKPESFRFSGLIWSTSRPPCEGNLGVSG